MNGQVKSKSSKERFTFFIRKNFLVIILAIGFIVFAFRDVIKWGDNWNTFDIITFVIDYAIIYAFAIYSTIILGKMGIKDGKDSEEFKATLEYYGKAKEEAEPYRRHLQAFCDYKNEEEKKRIQTEILSEENLFLDKLFEYEQDKCTKEQWKAIKRAKKVNPVKLIDKDLISERGKSKKVIYSTYLGQKQSDFEKTNTITNIFSKAIIPLALALVSVESLLWQNLLVGIFKAILVLFMSLVNYFTNYEYTTNDLRNRFINKADMLIEFKNLCVNNFFEKST